MSIEIIGLRFTHRKSINPSLYGPFFNYFGGGILRYYLQNGKITFTGKGQEGESKKYLYRAFMKFFYIREPAIASVNSETSE